MSGESLYVVIMGGQTLEYPASMFEVKDGWLIVNGRSRTPVAVIAQHRVVRAYYGDPGQGTL